MTGIEIIAPEDCGNAPRKVWLRDFYIGFANADVEETLARLHENVTWEVVGDGKLEGRDALESELTPFTAVRRVVLDYLITHGWQAAVQGVWQLEDRDVAFCDVFEFAGAKSSTPVKSYRSFRIAA